MPMPDKRLTLVTSCSSRKRLATPDECRIRAVPGGPLEDRFRDWSSRLPGEGPLSSPWPVKPAAEVYGGEHWSRIREAEQAATEQGWKQVDLWVCSAGYGLVQAKQPIGAYDATFTLNTPDSVGKDPAEVRNWWSWLNHWPLGGNPAPRSLADLVEKSSGTDFLVVLSSAYLKAVQDDLKAACERYRQIHPKSDGFVVISAGEKSDQWKELVQVDARIESSVRNGTRGALNARVALHLLDQFPAHRFGRRGIEAYLEKALENGQAERWDRTPLGDDEVQGFIRQILERDPALSCTRVLRQLRDGGKACEQKRFRDLFQAVKAGNQG